MTTGIPRSTLMPSPQRVATHTLQLFDDAVSRTDALVRFVRDGLEAGDNVLVVVTPEHWRSVSARLLQRSLQLDADIASYRLTVCSTAVALAQLRRGRTLQRNLFDAVVGTPVRQLCAAGPRLRAYGEMVDVLAGEGDFSTALRLEELWSDLLVTSPFDLICGYSSLAFADGRNKRALDQICDVHSHVRVSAHDAVGSRLLDDHG
jgi:hypothetical protein